MRRSPFLNHWVLRRRIFFLLIIFTRSYKFKKFNKFHGFKKLLQLLKPFKHFEPLKHKKMNEIISVSLQDIKDAQQRIKGKVNRTPLIRFYDDNFPGEIYLKLENLQPIASFKIRGACNAMITADKSLLKDGVYTASAGNMAQGVAWNARTMNIPCTGIVPDHAPQTKLDAITRLGAKFIKLPFNDWWQVLVTRKFVPKDSNGEGMKGLFVHSVSD